MSKKILPKIDAFYFVFVMVAVALAVLTIYTFRGSFATFVTAYEVDVDLKNSKLRIDRSRLEESVNAVYEKETIPLNAK